MPESKFPQEAISNPNFVQAVRELKKHRLWFDLPKWTHIKIGKHNYFWTTGNITIDRGPKVKRRGITAFIELVLEAKNPRTKLSNSKDEPSADKSSDLPAIDLTYLHLSSVTPPWE